MSKKIRTVDDLIERVDRDLSWRKLELSNLKSSIPINKNIHQQTLIRAGVALLYAHWEGFIKNICEYYLHFVALQRKKNNELKSCFTFYSVDREISKQNMKQNEINFARFDVLVEKLESRAFFNHRNKIQTKSNLKFETWKEILLQIGLDYKKYALKQKKIDELVNNRNGIAHGEYSIPEYNYFLSTYNIIIDCIEEFRDDIIASANNKDFLKK